MFSHSKGVLTIIGVLVVSHSAHAGLMSSGKTTEIHFADDIFGTIDGQPAKDRVDVSFQDVSYADSGPATLLRTNAGRFRGEAVGGDFDASLFYESESLVYLYCVDLLESIWGGRTVEYQVSTLGPEPNVIASESGGRDRNFDRVMEFLGALNYTLATPDYGFAASHYNWLNPDSAWMSGAVQVGIWESLYEDVDENGWSVSDGDFTVAGIGGREKLSSDGDLLLRRTFQNIGTAGVERLGNEFALVLTADGAQDMIAGDPPASVPVPTSGLLMLAGLAGIRCRWHFAARKG